MATAQAAMPIPPGLRLGEAQLVSTAAQRMSLGFQFGYVDGVMGGVRGPNGYQFYGSARSAFFSCSLAGNTPLTQGVYPLSASAADPVHTFTAKCRALLRPSGRNPGVHPGGILGAYDRDYLGGGPAIRISDGTHTGILLTYHAEFQYNKNPHSGGANIFFGTLGIAVSTDNGKTFRKLGQIIQPNPSRPNWIKGSAYKSLSVGDGPFILGNEAGVPVPPHNADPENTYLYVYYIDYDLSGAVCPLEQCLAVARARLADVMQAAFSNNKVDVSHLFKKYYQGKFEEPAATGNPNNSINSGRFSPVLKKGFSPSVIYDPISGIAILATQPGKDGIEFRLSNNLLQWPEAANATLKEPSDSVRYPSLMETVNEAGGVPQLWIFYSHGPGDNPTWAQTDFMARTIHLIPVAEERSQTEDKH